VDKTDALQEVIADATANGASVHVVHITSMGLAKRSLPVHDRRRQWA
jgi:hypothetical protein